MLYRFSQFLKQFKYSCVQPHILYLGQDLVKWLMHFERPSRVLVDREIQTIVSSQASELKIDACRFLARHSACIIRIGKVLVGIMRWSGISGHGAGGLVSHGGPGSTMKLPRGCTVISRYSP